MTTAVEILDARADGRLFRFGFAAFHASTPIAGHVLRDWSRLAVGDFVVCAHPEVEIRLVRGRTGVSVALGDVFVGHGDRGLDDVLARYAEVGDPALTDVLSGRFALLRVAEGELSVLNDPLGTRSVCYRQTSPRIVGSHPALVAELAGDRLDRETTMYMGSEEYRARRTRYLPGDTTRYRNIKMLVPNNVLDVRSGRTRRFAPSQAPSGTLDTENYLEMLDDYFARYARYLDTGRSLVVGATGGSDSRALIAALRAHGVRPRLLTWPGLDDAEIEIVGQIVKHTGLDHVMVSSATPAPGSDRLRDIAALNTSFTRGRPTLPGIVAPHVDRQELFLRGYGGEVFRGSWNSQFVPLAGEGASFAVRQYLTWKVKSPSSDHLDFTTRAFDGFFERGNVDPARPPYDIGDLNYLEHRMAMWASNVSNELDPVMSSHSFFNSRILFAASLRLPPAERRGVQLMQRITSRYDADLAAL